MSNFDENVHPRRGIDEFTESELADAKSGTDELDQTRLNIDAPLAWNRLSESLREVLLSAADLQEVVPAAVLVGGSVAALYAGHRNSYDHDHVVTDLQQRYEQVLDDVTQLRDWEGSPRATKAPMTIMGELGDVEAGLRQLRRTVPLEITQMLLPDGRELTVPTLPEALRIKAYLVVQRNQVRDYLDVAALADRLGVTRAANILLDIDRFYPESKAVSTQVMFHLAQPEPKDSRVIEQLHSYKGLVTHWQNWMNVQASCMDVAAEMLRRSDGAEVP